MLKHLTFFVALLLSMQSVHAQFANKWLSAGSLHNWYSEVGSEAESKGFIQTQQDGLRWPGIYRFTDMQAAKAMWLAAKNVTDDKGTSFPFRVVHAGPRVSGAGELFPTKFKLTTRFDLPSVYVDGDPTTAEAEMVPDATDPTMLADAMIENEVNTLLGIKISRKVLQFSQEFHDNYHIMEYTLTNTGNTDGDADIELPNKTVEGVMLYLQWRLAVAKESRYLIGNGTGWGLNTMIDARGDGLKPDPAGQQYRAQFAWHGKFPSFTKYDNIGAPIRKDALPALQIAASDTLGRLAASQFTGVVVLHADKSATEKVDDVSQPLTMNYVGSDDPFQSQNDAFNPAKMQSEYGVMTQGKKPRHAEIVEPSGLPGFLSPTGDPSLGTPGGISNAMGFGPYTLKPGESVRIVIAEAAAGLSREENKRVGRLFAQGRMSALQKNQIVFQGRDSLFQTFGRAMANFKGGYKLPQAPLPPAELKVNGGGDRIALEWKTFNGSSNPDAWEVYRAKNNYDSTYTMIKSLDGAARNFDDTTPVRGVNYFYYVQAVNNASKNNGAANTPVKKLRSSRYFAQTYAGTTLKRPAGTAMADIRIVPNPYNIAASTAIRFPDQTDKLAFFGIPAECSIEIYTELGELVTRIEHKNGTGDEYWDHTTQSRQTVVSGIYIAVITDTKTGEKVFKKFVIIR